MCICSLGRSTIYDPLSTIDPYFGIRWKSGVRAALALDGRVLRNEETRKRSALRAEGHTLHARQRFAPNGIPKCNFGTREESRLRRPSLLIVLGQADPPAL